MSLFLKSLVVCTVILLVIPESSQFFFTNDKKKKKKNETESNPNQNSQKNKKNYDFFAGNRKKSRGRNEPAAEAGGGGGAEQQPDAAPQQQQQPDEPSNNPYASGAACGDKDDALNEKVGQLRTAIDPKLQPGTAVHNYAKDDNYLIRWLLACEMNVAKCEELITKHVQWRQAVKVDGILDDKMDPMPESYPVIMNAIDKEGRPVIEWWLHDWDIGSGITNSNIGIQKLARYVIRMLEAVTMQLYSLNVEKTHCVRQSQIIVDTRNLDENKHACQNCLKIFAVLGQTYEQNYPNLFKTWHLINAENPSSLQVLKVFARSIKSQNMLAALKMYKEDSEWQAAFKDIFENNQLSDKFGGSMTPP